MWHITSFFPPVASYTPVMWWTSTRVWLTTSLWDETWAWNAQKFAVGHQGNASSFLVCKESKTLSLGHFHKDNNILLIFLSPRTWNYWPCSLSPSSHDRSAEQCWWIAHRLLDCCREIKYALFAACPKDIEEHIISFLHFTAHCISFRYTQYLFI